MTEPEWRTRIDWLIVCEEDTRVLALTTELPGTAELDQPGQALAVLREQTGIDAVVLRLSGVEKDETARTIRCTLVAAPRTASAVDGSAMDRRRVPVAEYGPRARPRRPAGTGAPVGPVRSAAGGHAAWRRLRQVVRRHAAFRRRGAVTAVLAELFPARVPAVLGRHGDRRLLALADFGRAIRHASDEVNAGMPAAYAALRVESVEWVSELWDAGCLDRRLPWLSGQITWLGEVDHAAPPAWCDPTGWLTAEEPARLRACVPDLMTACAQLAEFAVPYSLVHGDLHLGNVARGPLGYLFFDWTDAAIAHPFLDLSSQYASRRPPAASGGEDGGRRRGDVAPPGPAGDDHLGEHLTKWTSGSAPAGWCPARLPLLSHPTYSPCSNGSPCTSAHRTSDSSDERGLGGVGSVRRELLDRILIMNERHLREVLAEYETYFNLHRPHRVLKQASPLRPLPDPVDADIEVSRRDRLGGLLHEYAQVA